MNKLNRFEALAAAGAVGLALSLGGCASKAVEATPAEFPTTQTPPQQENTPSPNPEAHVEVPKKIEGPSKSPLFQSLPEKLQQSYYSMDRMRPEEFMRLPREQQLQYTDLTYRMVEDYVNKVLLTTDSNVFTPESAKLQANPENTDDEIIRIYDKRRAAAWVMMTQDGDLTQVDPNWKWRAKNYLIGTYLYTESKGLSESLATLDAATTFTGDPYNGRFLVGYYSNNVVKEPSEVRNVEFDSHYYQAESRLHTFVYEEFRPLDAKDGDPLSHQWTTKSITDI